MTEALLHPPKRNKYFYGKLLDVSHMQLEQCYGIEKRRLLNRLALGPGVLCGLHVTTVGDKLAISPGVAIDHLGREIVVPVTITDIDPAHETDAKGKRLPDKAIEDNSTIYLCYTECDGEPTPVYVSECDGAASTACSTTEERYRVVVVPGLPDDEPPELTDWQREQIFPRQPTEDFDRRIATLKTLGDDCPSPPDITCVVLATVTLPSDGDPMRVDPYTYRVDVYSNTMLFELIVALADRVDRCCAKLYDNSIEVTDGQDQSGDVSQPLPEPILLRVHDRDDAPVVGADVRLQTTDGDLSLDNVDFATDIVATSGADGGVTVWWRLGPDVGGQTFSAALTNGNSVTVSANGVVREPGQPNPPVVERLTPPNGERVDRDWVREPRIVVDFDKDMQNASLDLPGNWLRAWWFEVLEPERLGVAHRIRLVPAENGDRRTATYQSRPLEGDGVEERTLLVVVMMRGSEHIVAVGAEPNQLDADFAGTRLDEAQLDALWNAGDDFQPDALFSVAAGQKPDPEDQMPSGNGQVGGQLHAFFTIPANQ
ncbi:MULTISPECIES: hypothetical protein [unclassified Mycobacterium]|uniref:hypothetical protein n=1 Tax=unclassified Mycobacterium TaxID=2642494 RepID=UPI00048C1BBB|nr:MULTISPECIES: hypothetical protein [unclassified Mycobacterium]SEB02622.1 hypothetical protein SAMN04488580_106108 [Mycobacterium sp. 283mftsu]